MGERVKYVGLKCTEGGSNKQYALWLEESGAGWVTMAAWGPIGGHVSSGAKTPKPVTREAAEAVYDKVLKEKLGKGYVSGDVAVYTDVAGAVDTGHRPMLLTEATEDDLERLIADDGWAAMEKLNGKRVLLICGEGGVRGANRRGLECQIPEGVAKRAEKLRGVFDGELVGGEYHVFDALFLEGADARERPLVERYRLLEAQIHLDPRDRVPLVCGIGDKRELVNRLRASRREGVVFKRLDAPYEPGRRESLRKAIAVKVKFYAEGAFQVLKWNRERQSIEVQAARGGGGYASVGSVTVPAKYAKQIKAGAIVRVRYLYATGGDQLFQAHLDPDGAGVVVRDDVAVPDSVGSLKHEGKGEEE